MFDLSSLNQGWFFTLLSTCLCVLGCFIIYVDDLYHFLLPSFVTKRYTFVLRDNYAFMNAALSFSSGCLLFTALYRLLPEGESYLEKSNPEVGDFKRSPQRLMLYLFISYTLGMAICGTMNVMLHLLTSESVVHCSHSGGHGSDDLLKDIHDHAHDHEHTHHGNHTQHSHVDRGEAAHRHDGHVQNEAITHSHSHSHGHQHSSSLEFTTSSGKIAVDDIDIYQPSIHSQPDEVTPLIPTLKKSKSLLHYFSAKDEVGECKGYTSPDVYLFTNSKVDDGSIQSCPIDMNLININSTISTLIFPSHTEAEDLERHAHHTDDHHHHVSTPISHLLLIGIETTLAITLHKLPEGFITYITSETNKTLGVQIFLSLMLHNFTEGFLMCLPLYYLMAVSSPNYAKLKAVAISATLGGLSQPLGALVGYVFLSYNKKEDIDLLQLNFIFGITMAVTSGFLTVVGLSMFSSAIAFNRGSLNFVMSWCLVGMCLIGFSGVLTAKLQ